MMRVILLAGLALSACTSSTDVPLYKTAWEQIKEARAGKDEPPKTKKTLTRAQIDELNLALIQINLEGEDVWPIMTPTVKNGPFVTYGNKFRQLVTVNESQITATRGHGTDLIAATSGAGDPLNTLTSPDAWPTEMTRSYRFAGSGVEGRVESYICKIQRAGAAQVQIAGTTIDVIGFAESCKGAAGSFTNLYAADAQTGRVWQSRQFIGHNIAPMNLDVLEPLTEG